MYCSLIRRFDEKEVQSSIVNKLKIPCFRNLNSLCSQQAI